MSNVIKYFNFYGHVYTIFTYVPFRVQLVTVWGNAQNNPVVMLDCSLFEI
jgi:hypothetical protein